MNNYFERLLMNAVAMCEGQYISPFDDRNGFHQLYPFTTENIAGYISNFDLDGKSLLTVGSSGDQVINASLFNCKEQTVVDISPYTKFYFYLKKSALLTLDYHSFFSFFCYKDFPKFCKKNEDVFNLESFRKLKSLLRILDYESYLFWDELFSNYSTIDVRENLFSYDEDKVQVLKQTNIYLNDESSYEHARNLIKNVDPTFIIDDILKIELKGSYDNIILSNLAQYYPIETTKKLVDKLSSNLNDGGKMMVSYLYKTDHSTKYSSRWAEIYDLVKTFEIFNQYNLQLESFIGTRGILFEDNKDKDSILVYKKLI